MRVGVRRFAGVSKVGFVSVPAAALVVLIAAGASRASPPAVGVVSRRLAALPAEAASLILTAREGGSLLAEALAYPGGDGDVGLVVEIDGQSLLGRQAPPQIELELYAYVLSEEGAVRAHLAERVTLDLDRTGEIAGQLYAGGLRFTARLSVDPGSYRVRVLVRDRARRGFGLRELELVVPASDGAAVPGPLLVRGHADGWLEARQGSLDPADAEPISAVPVLPAGGEVTASLAGGVPTEQGLRLGTRFLDGEGGAVAAGELSQGEGEEEVHLQVPALAAGAYDLQVVATSGEKVVAAAPAQRVFVADERAGRATDQTWIGMARALSVHGETAGPVELGLSGKDRRDARAVADAYRQVLETLSRGDWEPARESVYRLESGVFAELEEEPALLLARGEMTIIDRLAKLRPEGLVPLMVLHLELQRRYVEERRFPMASHTDSLVTALAEIYAEKSESELGAGLAADVLASVGAYLQSAQLSVPARRMLERALALDERSPFALLQVAVTHEGRGEYGEAVSYLRRLLEVRPDSAEGRLRLALDLERLGENGEAARLLDRLIWSSTPQEIQVVAYQERSRIELDGGRPGRAASLLREATGRYPQQLRLQIQLAYALDRAGDRRAADEVAQRLDSVRARPGTSPRFRYGRAEVGNTDERRGALESAAILRLPALAAGLDRLPGAGGS